MTEFVISSQHVDQERCQFSDSFHAKVIRVDEMKVN